MTYTHEYTCTHTHTHTLTHTHTHKHTHTHTHTHTHAHAHAHAHAHTHTNSLERYTPTAFNAASGRHGVLRPVGTHTHAPTHANTRTHTHTHTHAHAHAHSHTHTLSLSLSHTQHSPPLAPDGILEFYEQSGLVLSYLKHDPPKYLLKTFTRKDIRPFMKQLLIALVQVHKVSPHAPLSAIIPRIF